MYGVRFLHYPQSILNQIKFKMNTSNDYQVALDRVCDALQKNQISEKTANYCEVWIKEQDYFENILGSVDKGTTKKRVSLYDMKSKALGHFQTFMGWSALAFYIIHVLHLIFRV